MARLPGLFTLAVVLVAGQDQPALDVQPGRMPTSWAPATSNCMEQPDWTVHEYNQDFYILRQSGCMHYEKPFVYLIFGSDRALLVDTGAGREPRIASLVSALLDKRTALRKLARREVLVVHSHGHGDHTAGDAELAKVPGVRVVAAKSDAVTQEFGIKDWPAAQASVDLGSRVIDVLPIPGHEPASIALYDRRTGILLTGDTVYPGRLYVYDWPEFRRSISRLVAFATARPVAHVLGAHIEQTSTPFRDYPVGTAWQPEEHSLPLTLGTLLELDQALTNAGPDPQTIVRRDFTIVPRRPRPAR